MRRKQLILDAGGVIVTNLTPGFWEMMAAAASINYEDIRAAYKAQISESLWTGALTEADFWGWLREYCPQVETHEAQALLHRNILLLPAFHHIPDWSELADIHILSNHRSEWLIPYLEPIRAHLQHVVISNEAGSSKPSEHIFQQLHTRLTGTSSSMLYVDDHCENIRAAERFGWQGLLADEEGRWIEETNRWLQEE